MRIAVIGATGMVGSRITAEAVRRKHAVTAVSRRPGAGRPPAGATVRTVDALDRDGIAKVLATADAAVASVRSAAGRALVEMTETLLDAAAVSGVRLLVVGGAGPLRSPGDPDRLVLDDPAYVESAWRDAVVASVAQLRACQGHASSGWTYLSPPAMLAPGTRTGVYRRGGDTLLTEPDGSSRISAEDLAVAVLDEVERPTAAAHFTVGY